ncbi:MAG: hypothetical protein JWO38_2533 [Gemmataceae bacterium]|nr:hypothetical protein [Gemmataceae bacterium]
MPRRLSAAVLGIAAVIGVGFAQPPADTPALRFKWQPGQTLNYKVSQQTVVQETTTDEKTEKPTTAESRTTLALSRRWAVKEVDASGTATLEMQITELRNEIRLPDGSTVVRDSTNPDHAKEMADYLNKPVVVVRVDAQGRLVEVKEAKQGSAVRLSAELPFRLTLPDTGPTAGQAWDRTFALKLDPPLGTGESHDFVQKYTCKGIKDGLAVVGVQTALKAPPKTTGEQVPLVPMLWTGEVYFNVASGKYHAARLTTKTELANHLGEGTKFVYQSSYNEDAVEK